MEETVNFPLRQPLQQLPCVRTGLSFFHILARHPPCWAPVPPRRRALPVTLALLACLPARSRGLHFNGRWEVSRAADATAPSEGEPARLALQGDHGLVKCRQIVLRPLRR